MTDKMILSELKRLLTSAFPGVIENVLLFGSRAMGTADDNSDFDILVITGTDVGWRRENEIINACYAIDLKYDVVTDVKILARSELNTVKGRQPYISDALASGVTA